jgi:hypothetical protein
VPKRPKKAVSWASEGCAPALAAACAQEEVGGGKIGEYTANDQGLAVVVSKKRRKPM